MYNWEDIPFEIDMEIRAANRGRRPRNQSEYERCVRRFGVTVQYFPTSLGESYACFTEGVIYVPELPHHQRPGRCHIHELAHACEAWEGREPYIAPRQHRSSAARHEVAGCVDLLDPGRPYLTQALDRQISLTAARLAELLTRAGYQSAHVGIGPGGKPYIDLGYKSDLP